MGTRENRVEKYLNMQVTAAGGITRKWTSPGRDGVPDRIVILKGDIYFVEIKTVSGKLSPIQIREHNRLQRAGAKVYTLYGHTEIDEFIEYIKKCQTS